MIEHCIAALKEKREQFLYRSYMADALKAIANNTAGLAGQQGLVVSKRYADIVEELKTPQKPEPTGEEIIEHMKNRLSNL